MGLLSFLLRELLRSTARPIAYFSGVWYESSVKDAMPLLFTQRQGGRVTARHAKGIDHGVDVECRGLRLEFRFHLDEVHVHIAPDHSPQEFLDLFQVLTWLDGERRSRRPFTSLQEVAGMFLPRMDRVREVLSETNFPVIRDALPSDWPSDWKVLGCRSK